MTEWMDIVCHSRPDRESSIFVAALGGLIQEINVDLVMKNAFKPQIGKHVLNEVVYS